MRIRRICSLDADFWGNVKEHVAFFVKRGYKKETLDTIASEVFALKREDLLRPTKSKENGRVPLIVDWHHKFSGLPKLITQNYERVARNNPEFKEVFPNPPMVVFRRQKSIGDRIVKSKHWKDAAVTLS